MADVFLSYARPDREPAAKIARLLADDGWTVFWDQVIPPGETWDTYIGRALANAACVVVLWSSHSISSSWVREEANEAKKRGILLPILIDDVEPPIGFRLFQALDLRDWRGEQGGEALEELLGHVRRTLAVQRLNAAHPTESKTPVARMPQVREPLAAAMILRAPGRRRALLTLGMGTVVLAGVAFMLPQIARLVGSGTADSLSAVVPPFRRLSRVAVVIGMQNYAGIEPLINTINDAELIKERLVALGFIVFSYSNLSRQALLEKVQDVGRNMSGAEALVIYFAGHGFRYDGTTWLVPVDAELDGAAAIAEQAVSVKEIVDAIRLCISTSIFLIDTCRSELFAQAPGQSGRASYADNVILRGIRFDGESSPAADIVEGSRIEPDIVEGPRIEPVTCASSTTAGDDPQLIAKNAVATNVALAFATVDGGLAFDGVGRNSPFAEAIADGLRIPGLELNDFFRHVRSKVLETTTHQQVPWLEISMEKPFYFFPVE